MLTAEDIMTEDVITVRPDTSVQKVARILSENEISGLPVVNSDNILVGIVSEKDLIFKDKKLHFPDYINVLGGIVYLESYKKFEEEFKKFIAIKVGDLMTEDVITVTSDTSLSEIATLMVEEDVNRLPVVKEERLIGIITRANLVEDMAQD